MIPRNSPAAETRSDDALVAAAMTGEKEAFGALFVRHAAAVRRLLTSVIGPTTELDDLVQTVFMSAHQSLSRFKGDAQFTTWLHRITVNTAISHIRQPRRLMTVPSERIDAEASKSDLHGDALNRERVRRMYAVLDTLSWKRRQAITLFYFQGLSLKEMAKVLDSTVPVIKSRLFFAKKELRQKASGDPYLAPLLNEMSI